MLGFSMATEKLDRSYDGLLAFKGRSGALINFQTETRNG